MKELDGLSALELAIETGERPPCDNCTLSHECKAWRTACGEYWKYVRGKQDSNFGVSVFGVNISALCEADRYVPSTRVYKEIYGDF